MGSGGVPAAGGVEKGQVALKPTRFQSSTPSLGIPGTAHPRDTMLNATWNLERCARTHSELLRDVPILIGAANELDVRPLLAVWRKVNLRKMRLEAPQAAVKMDLPKFGNLRWIDVHHKGLVKVDQTSVISPMIGWRKCEAVANIIGALGSTNGQDVGGIDKA